MEQKNFYSTLVGHAKLFVDKIIEELNNKKVGYCFVDGLNCISFSKSSESKTLVKLDTSDKGELTLSLYSLKLNKMVSDVFNETKVDGYIKYVVHVLFGNEEDRHEAEKYYMDCGFDKKTSMYHFAVINNMIERIVVSEIVETNNRFRVYFIITRTGERKFCLLNNARNTLFKTEEDATNYISQSKYKDLSHIKNKKKISTNQKDEPLAYVIKDKSARIYFCGFHERKQYETTATRYRRASGSYIITRVPNFTPNIEKAELIFSKESAERIKDELEKECGHLIVADYQSEPKRFKKRSKR